MTPDAHKSSIPGLQFLRSMALALVDEKTYDVRCNPSLWLGFLLGIPIPVLTFAADAAVWLKLLSLPAPVAWSIILGAAGRVGTLARQEQKRLEDAVKDAQDEARAAHQHLDAALGRSKQLEHEKEEVVSELKLAEAIQATLLPPPIMREDCEVVARTIPTRFIGGDYVHANVVADRWLYLVLLDVSGHGISAAMVVARLHGLVRRMTLTKQRPLMLLEKLNKAAQRLLQHTYFFLTAAVARIDLDSGELDYATAGHPAQLLVRAAGGVKELRTRNRLLGMDDDIFSRVEPSRRVQLEPGDSVVFFTDGVFEVLEDGDGAVLGERGLKERIRELGSLAPQLLIGEVLQELADFQGSSEFEDDVTMLVARYLGKDPESRQRS